LSLVALGRERGPGRPELPPAQEPVRLVAAELRALPEAGLAPGASARRASSTVLALASVVAHEREPAAALRLALLSWLGP